MVCDVAASASRFSSRASTRSRSATLMNAIPYLPLPVANGVPTYSTVQGHFYA
jgi:hypothetical protein